MARANAVALVAAKLAARREGRILAWLALSEDVVGTQNKSLGVREILSQCTAVHNNN